MDLRDALYSIDYYKTERIVQLTWLPGTQQLADQDFREALSVFAEGALQHRAERLIIDMRQFLRRPSDQVLAWRDEVIVPKYEQAGVKKIAWIWPGVPQDDTGTGAGYQQRYFDSPDAGIAWLTASQN